MAGVGRKPNQIDVKVLQPGVVLTPPPTLEGRALAIWQETVNDFPADYFRASDTVSLQMYCVMAAQMEDVTRRLALTGFTLAGMKGEIRENPLVGVQTKIAARLHALARSLKLSPASRMQSSQVPPMDKRKRPEATDTVGWRPRIAGVAG